MKKIFSYLISVVMILIFTISSMMSSHYIVDATTMINSEILNINQETVDSDINNILNDDSIKLLSEEYEGTGGYSYYRLYINNELQFFKFKNKIFVLRYNELFCINESKEVIYIKKFYSNQKVSVEFFDEYIYIYYALEHKMEVITLNGDLYREYSLSNGYSYNTYICPYLNGGCIYSNRSSYDALCVFDGDDVVKTIKCPIFTIAHDITGVLDSLSYYCVGLYKDNYLFLAYNSKHKVADHGDPWYYYCLNTSTFEFKQLDNFEPSNKADVNLSKFSCEYARHSGIGKYTIVRSGVSEIDNKIYDLQQLCIIPTLQIVNDHIDSIAKLEYCIDQYGIFYYSYENDKKTEHSLFKWESSSDWKSIKYSSVALNDIEKNQPTPKETITPKPAPSNTPTPENAETKKPYDTSLLNEDKLNLILDQMVEGKPGETVKVGTTIESKKYKYVDTVQLKIEYDPKLKCRLDRTYANTIKDGFCIIKDSSAYEYSIDEYATEIMPGLLFTIPSDAKPGTVYDLVWSDPESFDGFYFFSTHYTLQNYDCNLVNGSIVVLNPDGTLPENISKESGSPSLTTEPVDTSKPTASPSLSNTPELNTYNVTLKNGNQHQITADQNELRYKTNNPDVAVVSSKGLVTAIGEGTAIISVINMDGDVAQLNVTVESIQSIIYGDFNNDSKVDITDLSALSIYLVDKKQLSNAQSKAADVTGDGVVDLSDLAHLRRFLSKKVDWLGNTSNILL